MSENVKHKTSVKKIILLIISALLVLIIALTGIELFYYPHYKSSKIVYDASSQQISDGRLNIISSNVRCISPTDIGKRSWFYRADLIVKNISGSHPDIIGFQEVTKFHYSYLCDSLKGFDSVIEYRDDTYFSEACPIFYRTDRFDLIDKDSFWLSETPEVMSKDWGAACYRICSYVILSEKSSGTKFVVFNTHLDHISDEARINGIRVVLDKISEFGCLPSVIMGDLNATEDSETYDMATTNFLDVKYQTDITMTSCTYQNWGKSLEDKCIDYFMISKTGFFVNKYEVITSTYNSVYPSDHFPIFTQLEFTH